MAEFELDEFYGLIQEILMFDWKIKMWIKPISESIDPLTHPKLFTAQFSKFIGLYQLLVKSWNLWFDVGVVVIISGHWHLIELCVRTINWIMGLSCRNRKKINLR